MRVSEHARYASLGLTCRVFGASTPNLPLDNIRIMCRLMLWQHVTKLPNVPESVVFCYHLAVNV